MDSNYLKWLESTLNKENDGLENSYVEPSVDELVAIMEELPTVGKDWGSNFDILVLPLTLDQYWNAFWADEAPFFIPATERKQKGGGPT